MKAAASRVTSLRMLITSPMGFSSSATFLMNPRRFHMLATGIVTIDTYTIGDTMYTKLGATPWRKQELPAPAALSEIVSGILAATSSQITLGADVADGPVTYGTMQIVVEPGKLLPNAPAIPPVAMTCTYDKRTYLMASCKTAMFTETFEGYNDPTNAVVLPPDALAAVDAGPLTIPGAAVPAPAASPSP